MKPIRQILSAIAVFFSVSGMQALRPASTFTFVDPCFPSVSVTPVPGTHNCFNFSFMISGISYPNQTFSVNFGNGASAIGNTVNYCYPASSSAAQYTVSVTNLAANCSATAYNIYTVTLAPATASNCGFDATLTQSASSVSVCCSSLIPEISYTNNYGDGTGDVTSDSHTYANCGNYIIKRKRIDMNDPTDCYIFIAANIACPPVATGIEKNALSHASVFPNPAGNVITLVSDVALKQAQVFDLLGRKIIDREFINFKESGSIETAALVPGTYFLVIQLEDGSVKNMKFIKE